MDKVQYSFKLPKFEVFTDESEIQQTELCNKIWFADPIDLYEKLIDSKYSWSPSLDKLPAALKMENGSVKYNNKIPLGYKENETYYIYNHMEMFINLRPMANREETYQVVGFEI